LKAATRRARRRGPALRTPDHGDHRAERPLLDEVVASRHSQRHAHGALRPIDPAYHRRLDLRTLVGKLSHDHVAQLEPLYLEIDRHQGIVRPPRPRTRWPKGATDGLGAASPGAEDHHSDRLTQCSRTSYPAAASCRSSTSAMP